MSSFFRSIRNRYVRFIEKQGFAVVTVICVAVITATALWTDHRENSYVAPTPPVLEDVSAAQLQQQLLRNASTATPAPTTAPRTYLSPLENADILCAFNQEKMIHSNITGIWTIHDAVDLSAPRGSKVRAMADGVVVDAGQDELLSTWLLINHSDGVEALYAGMTLDAAYLPEDNVRAGDTIGFVGDGPLSESDLGPHLHLRVTKQGQAIDPRSLWESSVTKN